MRVHRYLFTIPVRQRNSNRSLNISETSQPPGTRGIADQPMDMAAFMKRLGSEWKGLYVHHSPVIDNKIVESRRDCAAKNACGTRSKRSHFQPRIRSMLVRVHRGGNKSFRCVSRAERLGGQ
jgi:hypothetical protein